MVQLALNLFQELTYLNKRSPGIALNKINLPNAKTKKDIKFFEYLQIEKLYNLKLTQVGMKKCLNEAAERTDFVVKQYSTRKWKRKENCQ
jgi:hypothetical protein